MSLYSLDQHIEDQRQLIERINQAIETMTTCRWQAIELLQSLRNRKEREEQSR